MSHSGCNGGRKWKILVVEKYGCSEATIFDSSKVFKEKWLRGQQAVNLFEHFLFEKEGFDFEAHALKIVAKVFNRPLWFKSKSNTTSKKT